MGNSHKTQVLAATFLGATLLSGCTAAPGAPPATTVAVASKLADAEAVTSAPPLSQWWHLYREPALDALVEEALTQNRDLRAAQANLLAARAMLESARGRSLPQTAVTAGAAYGSTLEDQIAAASHDGSAIRTGTRYGLGADISWELDLFGRLRSGVWAARADTLTLAAQEDGVRVVVAAAVTGAWLEACGEAHRADVARQALGLAQRRRDIAERLRVAGAGLPVDVLGADALVARVSAAIPMIEAQRHDALAELAVLTGHPPADIPPAASACHRLPLVTAPVPVGDGWALLRRRPDVRAAQQRLAASTARIGMAAADLYPRIAIGAMAGDSAPTPGGLGRSSNLVWSMGPLLSWSVPDLSAAHAGLRRAKADEAGALARFDATILAALKEVNQRAEDYQALLLHQSALRTAADRSQDAERLMRSQRLAGGATALEALDAERDAIDAQAALAQADSAVAAAQVALFKALGGGWQGAPPVPLPLSMPMPERPSPVTTTTFTK